MKVVMKSIFVLRHMLYAYQNLMRYKVPALPQAGSAKARRLKERRQDANAHGCRQLAGSTASERMPVQRAILSGESPSSLKQDIKRTTGSSRQCLSGSSKRYGAYTFSSMEANNENQSKQ
jgi:hypothetical protein